MGEITIPSIEDIRPASFHSYPSNIREVIVRIEPEGRGKTAVRMFERDLIRKFNDEGIKAIIDNKIVFECYLYGRRICFGFKDGVFSIGFNYVDDSKIGGFWYCCGGIEIPNGKRCPVCGDKE